MVKVLTVRTLGYGLLILALIWLGFSFGPMISSEAAYRLHREVGINSNKDQGKGSFGRLLGNQVQDTSPIPVFPSFGIVIEKIGANSKVVADVSAENETEYAEALKNGVAHAKGTVYPGQVGNSYLFAHSTLNAWDVPRYNAVFFLLRELNPGDRIIAYYQGKRFDYKVVEKKIVEANDVDFLTTNYNEPVLTLQTCWPPGTSWKRLIIIAKMR